MSENENSTHTHNDTYQRIVKTAQQLFMKYGYRAVSTRQIADLCGITQPALYHHFKNKQALYMAVIQHSLLQTEKVLNKINKNNHTFPERLLKMTMFMMENYGMNLSQMFHDIFHELNSSQQLEAQKWWVNGFLTPVIKMIEDGVNQGELKDLAQKGTTSTELAYFILNFIRSTLLPSSEPNQSSTEKKTKLMVDIFLHGVGL